MEFCSLPACAHPVECAQPRSRSCPNSPLRGASSAAAILLLLSIWLSSSTTFKLSDWWGAGGCSEGPRVRPRTLHTRSERRGEAGRAKGEEGGTGNYFFLVAGFPAAFFFVVGGDRKQDACHGGRAGPGENRRGRDRIGDPRAGARTLLRARFSPDPGIPGARVPMRQASLDPLRVPCAPLPSSTPRVPRVATRVGRHRLVDASFRGRSAAR